jgi:hypothetical protein
MNQMRNLMAAALLTSLSFAAQADQPPVLWKAQVIAKTSSGPQEFVLNIPDGSCTSAETKGPSGTLAALKVCMGNIPSPHTLHGWLITDPQEAAKEGNAKFEKAEHFTVGTEGWSVRAESSLYTVSLAKQ